MEHAIFQRARFFVMNLITKAGKILNYGRVRAMSKSRISFTKIKNALRTCSKDEKGVAAVEFALIFPVMLMLLMGAIELSERLYQSSRTTQAASIMGDLVTQAATGTISAAEINDFYNAMKYALDPFNDNRVKIYIVDYRRDPSDPSTIRIAWRKQLGSFSDSNCRDLTVGDLSNELKNIVRNGTDIVGTRVCWEYTTPLKNLNMLSFLSGLRFIKRDIFLRPRAGNKLNCSSGCS